MTTTPVIYTKYEVTVTAKFPAYGEQPGFFDIEAPTAKKAISIARRMMQDGDGWTRQDGPNTFKAIRIA